MRLALLVATAAWSGTASACVFVPTTYIFGDPPAHLTDSNEIEAWKEKQIEEIKTRGIEALEDQWLAHKAQLAIEARQGANLGAERLAEDLAVGMVPPVLPQITTRDDCGTLHGAELADPAGYIRAHAPEADPQLAAHLVELGIIARPEELELLPVRARRDLSWNSFPCTAEARERVRRRILDLFSEAELAHVWSTIHRLGFNYNSVESQRDYWSGARDFRLLKFANGRSGPLVFSDRASPVDRSSGQNARVRANQSSDTAALRQFVETDPVAVRMVDEIERELAGESVERCPETASQIIALAAELRPQTEARRRP